MFVGCYRHRLNSRGQLAIPVKHRLGITKDQEGNQSLFLMKVEDIPVYALTSETLKDLSDRIAERLKADRRHRHEFYSRIEVVDIDPQGRVVIPLWMRKAAGIEKEVVFVGAGSRIEIWPAEAWDRYSAESLEAVRKELDASISGTLDTV